MIPRYAPPDHRFTRRATIVAMGLALSVVVATPMAAIVDSGPVTLAVPQTTAGLYLNLVTKVSGITPASVPGWDANPFGSANLGFFGSSTASSAAYVVSSGSIAAALIPGNIVGPASLFSTTASTAATAFRSTGVEYLGLRFTNEATATINYGYLQLQTTSPNGFPATIVRYVFENTGQPITIPAPPPVLLSVASRKVHGVAGTFDVALTPLAPPAINSNPPTEPRQGPALALVFTFDKPIDSAAANVTEGIASGIQIGTNGNDLQMVVNGVADQQYLTVTITAIDAVDGGQGADVSVRIGMLMGDVNGSRVVTLADVGQVNAQLAQSVTASNFKFDVNASGTLTLADKGLTNASLTHSLPPP